MRFDFWFTQTDRRLKGIHTRLVNVFLPDQLFDFTVIALVRLNEAKHFVAQSNHHIAVAKFLSFPTDYLNLVDQISRRSNFTDPSFDTFGFDSNFSRR